MNKRQVARWMRQGAKLVPRCEGDLVVYDHISEVRTPCKACAVGAVLLAGDPENWVTWNVNRRSLPFFNDLTTYLDNHYGVSPITGETRSLWSIITTLNDKYHWTREAIAGWLEGRRK